MRTSPSVPQLTAEAAVVAVVFTVIFFIIHVIVMKIDENFAMSHAGMAVAVALSGVAGHLAFEVTGLNDKFIDYRL